jgi:hypothetical protein
VECVDYASTFNIGNKADGAFYIGGTEKENFWDEGLKWATGRGYGDALIQWKKSQFDKKWKISQLYNGNNALNVNDVEKAFHLRFQQLPLGRRLWKVAGAGGVGNKREKSKPYPGQVCILYRVEGLQDGMLIQ